MNDRRKSSGQDVQRDDTEREQQKSHGVQQYRTRKEGHTSQIGSGQDQQSSRSPAPRTAPNRKP